MKTFLESIPLLSTPRSCVACLAEVSNNRQQRDRRSRPARQAATVTPATHWRYGADRLGAKDKSARVAVCGKHGGA
jgi:hypothetical protein